MCGRYNLSQQECDEITEIVREVNRQNPLQPVKTGEVFPTDFAPLLLCHNFSAPAPNLQPNAPKFGLPLAHGFAAVGARWGFLPAFGKGVVINARAETVDQKPLFAQKLNGNRCLVPGTGFFEWTHSALKQKYLFCLPNQKLLFMAGIFQRTGNALNFVILTTAANQSMRTVHSRMPVVLTPSDATRYLTDAQFARAYLNAQQPSLTKTSCENAEQLFF